MASPTFGMWQPSSEVRNPPWGEGGGEEGGGGGEGSVGEGVCGGEEEEGRGGELDFECVCLTEFGFELEF